MKRIISIAKSISKPIISIDQKYEVDEMKTFVGNKNNQIWFVYGINRERKEAGIFELVEEQTEL